MDSDYRTVELSRAAERDTDALSDSVYRDVIEEILALEDDPFPPGSKPLRTPGLYSIRVYDQAYRVVYGVSKRRIFIERIRPRRIAYAGL